MRHLISCLKSHHLTYILARNTQKTYLALKQPPGNPPGWVFGPIWTCLYASMGYAAYRAWTTGTQSIDPRKVTLARQGATLYTIQLALNLIWMPLFFKFRRPIEATADIVTLTGITGYMAYIWSEVDEVATYAILPYLGWLAYATYLSVSVLIQCLRDGKAYIRTGWSWIFE